MLKKGTYVSESAHQTFNMLANRQIVQYEILKDNDEEIHQRKQIRDLQTRITALEMEAGKDSISVAPGPIFSTLDTVCMRILTCSSPRRTFFLHALSFECTSKLWVTFLNQFSIYFHI